jgi:hypothetical protein
MGAPGGASSREAGSASPHAMYGISTHFNFEASPPCDSTQAFVA